MATARCACLMVLCALFLLSVKPAESVGKTPLTRKETPSAVELKANGKLQRSAVGPDEDLPSPLFRFWGHIAKIQPHGSSLVEEDPVVQPPSTEQQVVQTGLKAASYSQWKQDLILLPILKQLGKGFFVESGALDGELDSNTLYYELNLGWSGLLVEPDPRYFPKIHNSVHRHAYAFNGCLSPTGNVEMMKFSAAGAAGLSSISQDGTYDVAAQPIHSLLEAVGQHTVDFWSLDVEGSEGAVLKATDFSKVEVGVLLIEMNKNDENNNAIREVMSREGFLDIGHSNYDSGILDHIYINPKYFEKRNLPVPTRDVLAPQYRDY